jgi:hypothetical protein
MNKPMKQPSYRVYGLQKTFAKDINGILTSDLIMIYTASTSSVEAGTGATTLVLRDDDDGHDSEDEDSSYYTTSTQL